MKVAGRSGARKSYFQSSQNAQWYYGVESTFNKIEGLKSAAFLKMHYNADVLLRMLPPISKNYF